MSCFFIVKNKTKGRKVYFSVFFYVQKGDETIDYRAFSANMLLILHKENPDITLKEKEEKHTVYSIQCGNQKIDLSSFYENYLNGANLREVSKNINNLLKKER